jgi:hypothetical protein
VNDDGTVPRFSLRALAECAEREVVQRERVYARLIAQGKMGRENADREIAMMKDLARRCREAVARDPQANGLLF